VRCRQSGEKTAQRHQLFSRFVGVRRSARIACRDAMLHRPATERSVAQLFRF